MLKVQNKYFILDRPKENNTKNNIKKFMYWLMAAVYKVILNMAYHSVEDKKYNVSICVIFKNEAVYLKEWIEFHRIVGVEHFYMYNNNSSDNYSDVLQPYITSGLVTLIEWNYNQKQMEAYKDCIVKYAVETKWLGFIDIDEFVVPKSTNNIYDFLKGFENRGSVNIYWRLYGTSGYLDRKTSGLVTEDFTVCWPKYCDIGKCFYNTAFGFKPDSKRSKQLHHKFWANYKGKDIPPVNIFNHICVGERNIADTDDFPIQINHYFTKSYKEYAQKRIKGDLYFKINPHDEEYFYEHEMKCTSTDYSAYKYLAKLKLEMKRDYERD